MHGSYAIACSVESHVASAITALEHKGTDAVWMDLQLHTWAASDSQDRSGESLTTHP